MKPSVEQIDKLLSQRSNLRPEEGYWQEFLQEFHHNQRQEAASVSAPAMWLESLRSWFSEISPSKWAYGAGFAYATASVVFLTAPRGAEVETIQGSPATHQVVPAPASEQLKQSPPDPASEGNAQKQTF